MKFQFSMLLCALIFGCVVVTSNAWPSDNLEFEQEENEDVMDTQEFENEESITDILAKIMYDGMSNAEESDYDDDDDDDDTDIDDDSLEALAAGVEKCHSGYQSSYYPCQLQIKVINAQNLRDRDKKGLSDPYVKITAHGLTVTRNHEPVTKTLRTKVIKNNLSPRWNQVLNFGAQYWLYFEVQVIEWDKKSKDDNLSGKKKYYLRTIEKGTQDMETYRGGHLYFELVD